MLGAAFLSELMGTALMILLGGGVSANNDLSGTKGRGTGWAMVSFGWGIAVYVGVTVAYHSGAQLNPAVTLGVLASGQQDFAPGVPATLVTVLAYFAAQFIGAFLGAVLVWLVYKKQLDAEPDPLVKLGVFATRPAIRTRKWSLVTEGIGTFVLVFVATAVGRHGPTEGLASLGPLPVALLITGLVASLGGPTGTALNPARDLAPRIAHAVLPIKGKGPSDWGYAWVPVLGPLLGGVLAGLLAGPLLP